MVYSRSFWFIPIQEVFIPVRNRFIPANSTFIPVHPFIPRKPVTYSVLGVIVCR